MSSLTKDLGSHGTSASWAGEFDCSVCRRKRLIAAEFSGNQIKQYRAKPNFKMKCKKCVASEAEKERAAATAASDAAASIAAIALHGNAEPSAGAAASEEGEAFACSVCKKTLGCSLFTNNQLNKARRGQPAKCKPCAEGADAANALGGSSAEAKQQRLVELRAAAKKAEATGSNAEKLKAAAAVCAAEAELVTGIKPKVIGKGRKGPGGRGGKGKGSSGKGAAGGKPRSLASLAGK